MEKKNQTAEISNAAMMGNELTNLLRENKLLESRSLFMSEAVTSNTAKKIVTDLLTLDSISSDPIYLYINSPGGEVNSGFAICQLAADWNPVKTRAWVSWQMAGGRWRASAAN